MSLKLNTPCVFSSLTLMSNTDLKHHIEYYKKILNTNIGAIVLPSIDPSKLYNSDMCKSISDCVTLKTGLPNNSNMGFSVLGPTSNIIPLNYGIKLAEKICSISGDVKIIGSIVNIGTYDDIENAVRKLCEIDIDALELNFSCPNIINKKSYKKINSNLLKEIHSITNIPISLKITPYQDYFEIFDSIVYEFLRQFIRPYEIEPYRNFIRLVVSSYRKSGTMLLYGAHFRKPDSYTVDRHLGIKHMPQVETVRHGRFHDSVHHAVRAGDIPEISSVKDGTQP